MDEIESLQKKLKEAKLKRELEKYGISEKKEKKEPKHEKDVTEKEVHDLRKMRIAVLKKIEKEKLPPAKKFFKKFVSTAGINKQINQKQKYLTNKQAIKNLEQAEKIESSKIRLRELQKKASISHEDLYSIPGHKAHKQIKFEDLF